MLRTFILSLILIGIFSKSNVDNRIDYLNDIYNKHVIKSRQQHLLYRFSKDWHNEDNGLFFGLEYEKMDGLKGRFYLLDLKYQPVCHIKERNIIVIKIMANDSLFFEGKPIDLPLSKDTLLNYYFNPQNSENKPEKELLNLRFYGDIEVPKVGFEIQTELINEESIEKTSWESLFSVIRFIEELMISLYHQEARINFKKEYGQLSSQEMEAIERILPFYLRISWELPLKIPPLPIGDPYMQDDFWNFHMDSVLNELFLEE